MRADVVRSVATEVKDEFRADQGSLLAAGVAFWALLSIFPALVALVSLYGLVSDPDDVAALVDSVSDALPESARELLDEQLGDIVAGKRGGLGLGVVVGIAAALWTASAGIRYLLAAFNVAFDLRETRGYVALRVQALVLTLGALLFVAVALGVVAVLPVVVRAADLSGATTLVVRWSSYLLIALGFVVGFVVLERYGPDRPRPPWRWTTPGAITAAGVWVGASLGFSWYTSSLGSYNQTYGSIGAVVVLMLWLYLSALAVVLGAEVDSVLESRRSAGGPGSTHHHPARPAGTT